MANLRAEVKEYCTIDVSNGNFFTMNDDQNDTGVIISLPDYYDYHPESSSYSFNMELEHDSGGSNDVSNLKESGMEQEEEDDAGDEDSHSVQTDVVDEKKGKDKFNVECLSYELQVGYRILSNMMSAGNRCINKLFLYPVDDTFPETADYYEKIKEPMWMFKMKEKFEKQEYRDVTEFMTDFRLMIENCYRFNGPDHFVSKKAQKLETMMKQKVALLKKDLRDKIAGAAASAEDDILASAGLRRRVRNPNVSHDDPSQQLLCQLRRDREIKERVDRRQKVEDRRAMEHARIQEMQTWEDTLLGPQVKDQIKTMWELPQIGLFVYLCMESLGLEEEVTQYQIERGLAVPRECSDFRRLMTCLLSTPHQRKSLKSFMPYHIWNSKLSKKLDHFYKVLSEKNGNQAQTCYFLGLDTRAFKVMGKRNPLLKKQFHQLSYLKRVWILKNFCDYCMETQPALQKTIDDAETQRPNDVREVLLGSDAKGNRYINFPMFTGKDIRIYKHPKHPEPSLESLSMEDWSLEPDKISATSSRCSTPVNRKNSRAAETPSASLRARVLLQAAESVEASPARDISRSGSEAPDSNSSPAGGKALSAQPTDTPINGARTKQTSSTRKRKHSSMFFNKRKRLKTNKKNESESKSDPERSDTAEGAKDEVSGGLSAQSLKSSEGSGTSESASCDKLANINSSELDSPDKSVGYLSADICREDINTPTKHSTSSDNLSAVAASSSGTLSALKDSERGLAEGSPQGCNVTSSGQQGCSEADGVNCVGTKTMDVIKPECNGNHDDSSLADCVKHADGSSPENGVDTIKIEKDLRPDSGGKTCGSVTPVKQELPHIDEKGFSALQSNIKQEYGDKNGGKLRQELIDNKSNSECDSGCGEIKNGKFQQNNSSKLKSEGHDGLVCDSKKDKDCLEIKTEPIHEETVVETKIEDAEKEEEDSDEEDLPDLGEIELVAENMEEIRELIKKLSNPDPVKKGRKVIPGVMKPCEEELVVEITRFHDELAKYERSLVNARIGMQAKLRKEVEGYVEPKMEEAKAWESECSQSSSDESEEETVSKPETNKPPKKTKQKSATTALLSSAASKLSSMTGEENGDSNDSFELDISSRGRLRKRRVIPNNTEDTGLKKRKNLPNQDAFFSVSPATVASTTTLISNQGTLTSSGMHPLANQLPAAAASDCTIKAQLASHTPKAPGQIVRLIAPGSVAGLHGVHLDNVSSRNLQNIHFISSVKSAQASKNTILASSAQTSHPVIQQLLLNQAKPTAGSVVTTKASNDASRILQRHLSGISEGSKTSAEVSSGKIPIGISMTSVNSLSPSKASLFLAPSSAAVVVTQVSTSVSQGGKQVLDLGSLSVTQLEQLVKNQAIQINTSAGGTTTLLLTTGLQHLTAARASGASVIQAAAAGARASVEPSMFAHSTGAPGMSSLLTMIKKPQMALTGKPNSWLTIPTQIPAQTARTSASTNPHPVGRTNHQGVSSAQVHVNQGLSNAALQTALARTVTLASPTPGTILMTPAQFASVAKTINSSTYLNSLTSTSTQKSILAPRIISSLASAGSQRVALGAGGSIVLQKPVSASTFSANGSSSVTVSPETLKSRVITVPLVHLSPSKKYAGNVTVKTLIQNRGNGRSGDEEGSLAAAGEPQPCLGSGDFDPDSLFAGVSCESGTAGGALVENSLENQSEGSNYVSSTTLGAFQTHTYSGNELYSSHEFGQVNNTGTAKLQQPFVMPLSRQLWVDTAAQSSTSASVSHSEIILPTVNIKVPSPNTLPSVQHNKNGTTIVQSTKVPIPVASEVRTGDSLSPSGVLVGENTPQGAAFHAAQLARRAQPAGSNLVLMSAANSKFATPVSGDVLKLPAGLKNVTLKITPQGGSAGQFVQGFMTSQGLVIPQTALLQPHLQSGSVILGSTVEPRAVTQLNTNQVKIQPSSMLTINSPQNIQNLVGQHGQAVNQQLQHPQLTSQKVIAVANNSLCSTGKVQGGILSQNPNPGLKIMLVNTPTATVSSTTSSTGSLNVPGHQQQKSITAPASELVKQIANSSQVQRNSNHQVSLHALSPGNGQQNAAYLLNSIMQGSVLKQTSNGSALSGTSPASQTMNSSATVNPQLTAQVLALQQNSQVSQQYKPNLVLAAKPVQSSVSSSQNKPPVISFQVQQLGQLISNLGGVSKIQMDRIHHVQNPQVVSVQKQVAPTLGQSNQVIQPASGVPNSSQVVRVAGQLSPQLQLQNQGLAQIQPQGNVVIQQQALLPQQQSQSFIIQQPSLSQSVLGSNSVNIQLNAAQPQINAIQQQLSKTLQQPATCLQSSVANKVHFTGSHILNQQLLGMSHNPGLVFSHLQASTASTASGVGSQPQIQFVINPSSTSNPSLSVSNSSVMSSSSMLQVSSSASTGLIRTESAVTSSGMNTHGTSISGVPHLLSPPSSLSHAVIVGTSPVSGTTTSTASKLRTHMIIPSSAAGKFLISPVKMSLHNPHASPVNPIKYVSAVQTQNPSSVCGLTSSLATSTGHLPSTSVAEGQGHLPVRPGVIYAGHQATVADKKEGKIAQILLSQPVVSMQSSNNPQSHIVGNHYMPASVVKLQTGASGVLSSLGTDQGAALHSSKTLLYKIGDQYFTSLQHLVPQTALTTSDSTSTASNQGVQLLVPPSFIEASDQILKQSSKSATSQTAFTASGSSSSSIIGNSLQSTQHGVRMLPAGREGSTTDVVNQMAVPLNGIYQNKPQFSFSLSGPVPLARSDRVLDSSVIVGSQIQSTNQSDGSFQSQMHGAMSYPQSLHVANSDILSTTGPIDKVTSRRNTFSGGQDVDQKGALPQRHVSADDAAGTLDDQDEKEAALNLLTLANQPI
ncbi:unnamed protein product [Candidula unifasciata]|uniref:Bromo domain-containing protein n=1 Tax=Candidula unifasciata TaxID=100452 RepID=A0A8S3YVT6_9EUPU|nr:unnamed protein product [Candidula unifasciata]